MQSMLTHDSYSKLSKQAFCSTEETQGYRRTKCSCASTSEAYQVSDGNTCQTDPDCWWCLTKILNVFTFCSIHGRHRLPTETEEVVRKIAFVHCITNVANRIQSQVFLDLTRKSRAEVWCYIITTVLPSSTGVYGTGKYHGLYNKPSQKQKHIYTFGVPECMSLRCFAPRRRDTRSPTELKFSHLLNIYTVTLPHPRRESHICVLFYIRTGVVF